MLTLNDGRSELWQWDTGRTLSVDADCSQVHFSNKVFGRSIDVDVADGVAIIPDIFLQTDRELNVWAFVGTAENGYTKISKTFKVNRRNKPADYVFTPVEQTTIAEIAAIAQSVRDDADAGLFDGKDGYTPKKGVDYFDGAPGADGKTPEYGVDYGTPEQISGIAQQAAEILQPEVNQLKDDLDEITIHDIGKNIFFSEWSEIGKGISAGQDVDRAFNRRTGFIKVEPLTTYTLSTDFGLAPNVDVYYYSNKNTDSYISGEGTPYGFYPKTITTPENTKYIRIAHRTETESDGVIPTNYQIEKGSIATSYEAPYDNLLVPASVVKDIPTYKGKKFLFLGDSITAMSGDTSWVDKFKELAEVGESYNQAVGGAKWCDDESGITYNGTPYSSQNFIGNQVAWCQNIGFASSAFDYIFISAGTNDTNLTFPTDEQIESEMYSDDNTIKPLASVDRSTWMGAIRWTVQTLRGMYPNAKIILVTPLQRRVDMDGTTLKDMYSIIRQKREIIVKMAKRMGVYVIDTSECDITNFDSTDFADNLHPSAKGAEKLAKFIFKKSIHIFCEYN